MADSDERRFRPKYRRLVFVLCCLECLLPSVSQRPQATGLIAFAFKRTARDSGLGPIGRHVPLHQIDRSPARRRRGFAKAVKAHERQHYCTESASHKVTSEPA